MRTSTPACPLSAPEWYSSCEYFLFPSDFSELYHDPFHVVSFSTTSSICTCSSFSNVLANNIDMKLIFVSLSLISGPQNPNYGKYIGLLQVLLTRRVSYC